MNNYNNKNKNNFFYKIMIFFLLIFLIILIVEFYFKFSNKNIPDDEMGMYDVQESVSGDGKNMNNCLNGCVRGVCNKKKGACKYDFQCQYCKDIATNSFYVDFNDERRIIPVYEEDKKLNINQTTLLNDSISKNNRYINMLNHKIELMNS